LGWDSVSEPEFAAKGVTVLGKDGFTVFFKSQMYVAPRQNIVVATILAGPATLPGGVVIAMSKRIMWAALEDKGVTSSPDIAPQPLPAAPIPERLYRYAGIYGGVGHSIIRIALDETTNMLATERLENGEFVRGASFEYRSDGRFYAPDNRSYSFARGKDRRKLFQEHVDDRGDVATIAEGIGPGECIDTSGFDGTTWVPHNLRAFDFVTLLFNGIYKTGSVPTLPGVIYLHAGNPGDATPYALSSRYRTRMILQYETDLEELEIISKDGGRVLKVGAFEFIDAESVAPFQQSEQIVIGPGGGNVARKVVSGTAFTSSVPPNGRILIYDEHGETTFDSLFAKDRAALISPGSIIVFIGDPDAVFVAQTT